MALLGLVALWLTWPGTPVAPSSAPAGATGENAASRRTLTAADVAFELSLVNPTLSPPERQRIAHAVIRYSGEYGLDPELVTAVIKVESAARPEARSAKGAIGLMQVMPHMITPLRLVGNFATVETNVAAGCRILSNNIRRLGERDGILAYFWGSDIRGSAYFERVRSARTELHRRLRS